MSTTTSLRRSPRSHPRTGWTGSGSRSRRSGRQKKVWPCQKRPTSSLSAPTTRRCRWWAARAGPGSGSTPPHDDRVADSLAPSAAGDAERVAAPDRVFLNLENVRGQSDATAFSVYLGVGDEEDPAEYPERLAGSIAPFGVSQASDFDDEHAGQGLTFVLEITDIVDQLHLEGGFDVDSLPVRIVPVRPIGRRSELSIGRISIFRQGR